MASIEGDLMKFTSVITKTKMFSAFAAAMMVSGVLPEAQAFPGGVFGMQCVLKEGGREKAEFVVQHLNDGNPHMITHFETTYTKGFVAISRGYGVINFVPKTTGRAVSFHGNLADGGAIGGTIFVEDRPGSYISFECKQ
jgi:hypothetical protein